VTDLGVGEVRRQQNQEDHRHQRRSFFSQYRNCVLRCVSDKKLYFETALRTRS